MTKVVSHPDYPAFLAALKERILHARIAAARAVNRDLILLYWDIGKGIIEKQRTAGWGDAVVERLASDLRAAFPATRGFSADNLWRMRQFFAEYSDSEFLEQTVPAFMKPSSQFLEQLVARLNEKERASDDQPSIGIILCAEKDDVEVEFALKTKTNPIGVAEYQLQPRLPARFKGQLPSAKQLSEALRKALPGRK